ncbi:hypothetical protein ACO0LF_26790 [Undibacterium sp. Di27W]|uniref:hypothetical protein n=1 Tax=Undibacterium sp. Di27W TaxID=3413036 RepID=UPI003BF10679
MLGKHDYLNINKACRKRRSKENQPQRILDLLNTRISLCPLTVSAIKQWLPSTAPYAKDAAKQMECRLTREAGRLFGSEQAQLRAF